jgi:hypothetical protein
MGKIIFTKEKNYGAVTKGEYRRKGQVHFLRLFTGPGPGHPALMEMDAQIIFSTGQPSLAE